MGYCTIAGKTQSDWTKAECLDSGGVYSDSKPEPGTGNCFITSILTPALADTILDLGSARQIPISFRDEVLATSPLGEQLIKIYYKYNPYVRDAVRGDAKLLAECIQMWWDLMPFIAGITPGGAERMCHKSKFKRRYYRRVCRLFKKLRNKSDDKGFHEALIKLQTELERYVGLSSTEALQLFKASSDQAIKQ